jgi:hypothetical protein
MSNDARKVVEDKGSALGHGEKNWVKPNMRLFTKTYKLKAVDCLNLSRGAGLHIFSDTMGDGLDEQDKELQTEAFEAILTLFHLCCTITCNVDGQPPTPEITRRYITIP